MGLEGHRNGERYVIENENFKSVIISILVGI